MTSSELDDVIFLFLLLFITIHYYSLLFNSMKLDYNIITSVRHLLNENKLNNSIFYHGSKYPKISFEVADNVFGRQLFGYGFYVSSTKQEPIMYYALDGNTDGYLYTIEIENPNMVKWDDKVAKNLIGQILQKIPNFMSNFIGKSDLKDFSFENHEYIAGDKYFTWDLLEEPLPQWAIDEGAKVGYFLEIGDVDSDDNHTYSSGKYIYGLSKEQVIDIIKKNAITYNEFKINDPNIDVVVTKNNVFNSYENLYWYLSILFKSNRKASKFLAALGIDVIYGNKDNINIINPAKILILNRDKIYYKDKRKYF